MDQQTLFLTILGMALVTYLPRALPAWALSSRQLSETFTRWLGYIPAAVLAALLAPALVAPTGASIDISTQNIFLWASIPCFLLAWRTGNFFATVALGMGLVAAARYFGLG